MIITKSFLSKFHVFEKFGALDRLSELTVWFLTHSLQRRIGARGHLQCPTSSWCRTMERPWKTLCMTFLSTRLVVLLKVSFLLTIVTITDTDWFWGKKMLQGWLKLLNNQCPNTIGTKIPFRGTFLELCKFNNKIMSFNKSTHICISLQVKNYFHKNVLHYFFT